MSAGGLDPYDDAHRLQIWLTFDDAEYERLEVMAKGVGVTKTQIVQSVMRDFIAGLSNRVMAYTENEFGRETVLEWLMKVPSREVSAFISGNMAKSELKRAIRENRSPKPGNK